MEEYSRQYAIVGSVEGRVGSHHGKDSEVGPRRLVMKCYSPCFLYLHPHTRSAPSDDVVSSRSDCPTSRPEVQITRLLRRPDKVAPHLKCSRFSCTRPVGRNEKGGMREGRPAHHRVLLGVVFVATLSGICAFWFMLVLHGRVWHLLSCCAPRWSTFGETRIECPRLSIGTQQLLLSDMASLCFAAPPDS